MVQLPSTVPLPELGQASLVFALAEVPLARRFCLQARPLEGDGYLTCYPLPLEYTFPPLRCKDGILWYERDHGRRKDFLKIRSKMLDLYKLIWYSLNSCSTFVQCG